MQVNYHNLENSQILEHFDTSLSGLSASEAKERLTKYGYNKLPDKEKASRLKLFLHQFRNPLIYILFIAAALSFATGHIIDGVIVSFVIFVSSLVGYFQEYKASQALEHLRKLVEYHAKVIRDGKEVIILQEEVVPGDIILLRSGDKVPADARLIEATDLSVIEAALTGESVPSDKVVEILDKDTPLADRENIVYLGTVISKGSATAVVIGTGLHTELGKVASLVQDIEEEKTPLQLQLTKFSKMIGVILIGMNILIFGLGILTGKPLFEMFMTSVAVVVSAVPEGLLPAMTIVLAVGAQKLAKRKGLVRNMLAAETLGSVTVICTDKTGTLTKGEMTPTRLATIDDTLDISNVEKSIISTESNSSYRDLLVMSVLCNDAIYTSTNDRNLSSLVEGNHTDKALLLAAQQFDIDKNTLTDEFPRIHAIPFDSDKRFMATLHSLNEVNTIYIKGAPEVLIERTSNISKISGDIAINEEVKQSLNALHTKLTSDGFRVIAIAKKNVPKNVSTINEDDVSDLTFMGLIALEDPLKPETKYAISCCQTAGIRPIMITGDHKLTAISIGKQLGLSVDESKVVDGSAINDMSEEKLRKVVASALIFARVEPQHKIRIVEALQKNGEVVAMTGDGINDSPALKKADIGVAVGSGTDVAKEVSDLILLDDNFNTIVEAVRRGRIIFDNIVKVILYLITDSFSEMVIIGTAVIFGLPLPILPVQILWIKLIEDTAPAISLAFDEVDENVMSYPPRDRNEHLLNRNLKKLIVFYAIIMDATLFGIFYYYWKTTGDLTYARTITFVGLGLASLFYIYSVRGIKISILEINPFSNKLFILSTVFGLVLFLLALYLPFFNKVLKTVPLGISEWVVLLLYASLSIVVYEVGKKLFTRKPVVARS